MKIAEVLAEFRKRYDALSPAERREITEAFMGIEDENPVRDPDYAWEEIAAILMKKAKAS